MKRRRQSGSLSRGQIIFIAVSAVLSVASLVFFVPWINVFAVLAPLPDTVAELVEMSANGILDGIVAYLDTSTAEPELYAAGWKDRDQRVAADPNALFRIASITKLYVAASVAKLVDAEVLSLDRSLASYLPSLEGRIANADQITLRMMVQHRSGIPEFVYNPNYRSADYANDWRGIIDLVLDEPAVFPPGRRYAYSNTNYLLVGMIIDEALGYSYQQYIRDEILRPLGLRRTFSSLAEIDLDELASGYDTGYCCDLKTLPHAGPAGSMIATARDVGVFLRALNDGSLLTDSEQAVYTSIYEYGHTGLLPGYSSIARYREDMDAVVVVFVNTSGGSTWGLTETVYRRILRVLRRR